MIETNISINQIEDYKTLFNTSLLTSGELLVENEFNSTISKDKAYYNSNLKAARLYSTAGRVGYLLKTVDNLQNGDVVEFSYESLTVSGESPKFSVDNPSYSIGYIQSEKSNQFTKTEGQIIVVNDGKASFVVGLFTADEGDFYIRNIQIKIKSANRLKAEVFKSMKSFVLNSGRGDKKDEIQVVNDYAQDKAKISYDTSGGVMWLEYEKPFDFNKFGYYGTGIASMSAPTPKNYEVFCQSFEQNRFSLRLYDNEKKYFVSWENVKSQPDLWLTVFVMGYDMR